MRRIAVVSVVLLLSALCFAQVAVTGHVYLLTPRVPAFDIPIPNALVTLESPSARAWPPAPTFRTGPDGSYIFTNVPQGPYTLTVNARGYAQIRPPQIAVRNSSGQIVQDIYLLPLNVRPEPAAIAPRSAGSE